MRYLTLILCVILLAGCGSNDDPQPQAQPTAVIEQPETDAPTQATEEPTPQIFVRNTLPPTWTPVVDFEQENWLNETPTPDVINRQTSQRDGVREEWTPVFVPTFTPECSTFSVSEADNRFINVGDQPIVGWSGLVLAELYQLRVFDQYDQLVYQNLLNELQHQLPATTFLADGVYGWIVTPLDALGFPMCDGSGDYFVVGDI